MKGLLAANMKNKYLAVMLAIVALIYFTSCAAVQQTPVAKPAAPQPSAAASPAAPAAQQKQEISPEVKLLLDKSKTRVQNIYYKYKGPETGNNFYEFYAKGSKIKYLPFREIKILDRQDSFNAIYIDKISKTAQTYCDDRTCVYKGKKADLNYNSAYISTIFDWIDRITQANKVGEEVIDDRSTWKVETNDGVFWLDAFYGLPLKIQSSGNIFRFEQLNVNGVQDADVTHS